MPATFFKSLNAVPLTTLIQEGSKCPTITAGDISIEAMYDFEKATWKFFNNNDINDEKQVLKVLDYFDDHHITDWVEVDCKWLVNLIFMTELCHLYLQPMWEEMTCAKFLSLPPNTKTFWEFAILVQKTNSLPKGTDFYKDPCAVCKCIKGGIDQVLFKSCVDEKVDKITHENLSEELQLWMDKVEHIDDKMGSYCEDAVWEFEAQPYAQRYSQHNIRETHLTDSSHHANTLPSSHPASSSFGPNAKHSYLPNLTEAEQAPFRDNEGCFKCCHAFAGHHAFKGKCEVQSGNGYVLTVKTTLLYVGSEVKDTLVVRRY